MMQLINSHNNSLIIIIFIAIEKITIRGNRGYCSLIYENEIKILSDYIILCYKDFLYSKTFKLQFIHNSI